MFHKRAVQCTGNKYVYAYIYINYSKTKHFIIYVVIVDINAVNVKVLKKKNK